MDQDHIVVGQKVAPTKLARARQLRREMTPAERTLWAHLRNHRMCGLQFRRQQVIDGFIVDFYCHATRLVVEVDGAVHEQQTDYDVERDRVLAARGLQVLRFTNDEIRSQLSSVIDRIAGVCELARSDREGA
jgi:very-short-patch-repair endonuclease